MNTVEFLRLILPDRGLYVAARLIGRKFKNTVCASIEEVAQQVLAADAAGVHVYHACAAYREESVEVKKPDGQIWHQVRTQSNVRALKCFFMDLDVEPGNPAKFESQEAALDGLVDFCWKAKLPVPMIVSSGGGIHVYWRLSSEVQPEAWKQTAEGLKVLCAKYEFKADPACTSDSARVLRPVGTFNRKHAGILRPVEVVAESEAHAFARFSFLVAEALKHAGVKPPEGVRKVTGKTETINAAFAVQHDFPPCSAHKIADRCAQLAKMRDTRGNIPEPLWYSLIQLLNHSIEGTPLIHQWSNGYAGYSAVETDAKIEQAGAQTTGPALCATIEARGPGGCDDCPFKGKISSPIQLGTYIAAAPAPTIRVNGSDEAPTIITLPDPPFGFTRGEKGGIFVEEEGITHKIYENDMFPVELAWDEQLGYETMRWRHFLPNEGWKEFTLQASLLAKPVDFEVKLRDNHIQPLIRNKMAMYGDAYIRKLRAETKLRQLFKSQGWKNDETDFVLGDKLYRADETVQAGFSHGMSAFLAPFHSKGELGVWRTLTEVFDTPGLEPHAFMLLLAFAAPLLKLAGWQGCTVNALGDTGIGKSTMAGMMSSVYGHPTAAWVGRNDTALARMQRLGAHYNLPVYMDEATTIKPEELRDLIYSIPTGKNRASMRTDYTLRPGAEWVTLFVTSTNNSLQAKLQLENQNAEAESLRLFEFNFPRVAEFAPIAKIIPDVLRNHYGVAGPVFIQHLVRNRDAIRDRLSTVMAEAEQAFGMNDKERFWTWLTALVLYGGQLAREAGVIAFDPDHIRGWLLTETRRMRVTLDDGLLGPVAILANFLNEHVGERLVVNNLNASMAAASMNPHYEISQRLELDSQTLWISRKRVKYYMDKHHFNFAEVQDGLMKLGVLTDAKATRTLGAGTNYTSGPVPCWRVVANHEEMRGKL